MTTTDSQSAPKIIPHISSDTAGPLGAVHLPRLWAKLSLAAAGKLPDDYDECGTGFDQMTIDDLNLDRQKMLDFVRSAKPTYIEFERWVVQQNGGNLDARTIQKHNDAILAYEHSDATAADMRAACGLSDERVKDAVTLNKLEDLDSLYRQIVQQ